METRIHRSQFDDASLPQDYRAAVKSAGQLIDGWVVIPTERLNALKRQYNRPLPPLTTQLANAVTAAVRVGSAVINGNPVLADDVTQQARRQTCHGCLYLQVHRCTKCGCYYEAKIQLATEHCPLKKW